VNKYLTTALFLLIFGVGTVGGAAAILNALQEYQSPQHAAAASMVQTPHGAMKHVYLSLDTFPNFPSDAWLTEHHYHYARNPRVPVDTRPSWVLYGPTPNLVVPAHSEVTITIRQYDSGISLLNNFYSHVQGTVGNTMTLDGKKMGGIASDQVAHTFTIHGVEPQGQPYLFVSIPLARLPDNVVSAGTDNGFPPHPHVITFSFYVTSPGKYVWQCEYPCGSTYNSFGGAMSTNGYMNGTFDVTA